MNPIENYTAVNKANWESRVPLHEQGYQLDAYRHDPDHLSPVVAFDRPRLGDIEGLDVVHLQCHIGTDTLSLARLGATVTGLDFSPSALSVARQLAEDSDQPITYVESDVLRADEVLGDERFDLVYTGIGAICWVPEITPWARVVAALLRPGGRLFIRDGHPVLLALDYGRDDDEVAMVYDYFEGEAVVEEETETYVEADGPIASPTTVSFNHGIGEIVTAVLAAGMRIDALTEHNSAPWNALGAAMAADDAGEFRLRRRPNRLPATFTLQATKVA
ncbi:class I SAM-dependent methyltransferase [Euzebya tangerina]|uniref:class I SAM-dependent methyltransferase n=1 Tax=Euzebya tangerina TaxID=591198 RepID=UPI000E323766|nr:class I SAM-dependent methyltransferase [Euzebya tangerina]